MISPSDRWRALAPRQRTAIVVVAILVGALAIVATLSQRDRRVALFAAPLRSEQVAEVTQRLAEWNVAFVTTSDNVKVDARRRNEFLLRLSLAGIPHAHRPGSSEVLARIGPLTPQSVLDAQQREGLAGDLATALRGIAGIDDAQVIVAPGRAAAFADESGSAPSAGVRLRLGPGVQLERSVIDGIRQFVADSVSGLSVARVAVLDDRGLELGEGRRHSTSDAATLQSSLQSALDQSFGAGATIVRVRLDYDARSRELRDFRRAPLAGSSIVRSSLDEQYSNDRKHFSRVRASEDRGSDVHEEKTEVPAGGLERISAAVVVDATRNLDLAAIRTLSSATLGLVEGRDVLRVEAVAFAPAPNAGFSPLWVLPGLAASLAPIAAWCLAGYFVLRWGAPPLGLLLDRAIRRITVARASRVVSGYPPARVRGILRDEPPHTAAAIISALPAATASAVLELYPAEERAAIVRRMQRETAPVVPDCETILRDA